VGALAVALGVSAAISGSAVAWADGPPSGSGHPSLRSDAAAAAPKVTARQVRDASGTPRPASATAPRRDVTHSLPPRAAVPARGATAPAIDRYPAPAPVSDVVTAAADPLADPLATDSPGLPVESPAAWTVLPYIRRTAPLARTVAAAPSLAATQPVVLGPSGVPIPSNNYVTNVINFYVEPNSPDGTLAPQVVFTPEGLYPITGVKSLPLNTSVDQGLTILSDALASLPDGTTTTVFGYSQSAIIGSLLQAGFVPPNSNYVPPKFGLPTIPAGLQDSINFVFVGNEMNPNGGFLSRFPGLSLTSLGIDFYGATPENAYPTTNYALEYDGFADFPRYPLNFLADLNAGLGIVFVHTQYANANYINPTKVTPISEGGTAIELPTTSPTQRYLFMPTQNLPLLQPLRFIPLVGNPIADLIQPVLKVIVNLGYGDPAHGFTLASQPDANVLVPFGLFPDVGPGEVLGQLVAGVRQGISDFAADFGPTGSIAREISSISLPSPTFSLSTPGGLIAGVQNVITTLANRISFAAAGIYAALLPTADIINALVTSLPAYAINLVLSGVEQVLSGDPIGGLINAIGLPIAASVGLATTAALVGVAVWLQGAVAILGPM
jgi:hypothetical protein